MVGHKLGEFAPTRNFRNMEVKEIIKNLKMGARKRNSSEKLKEVKSQWPLQNLTIAQLLLENEISCWLG